MDTLLNPEQIGFLPSHKPALEAGEYFIEIKQRIESSEAGHPIDQEPLHLGKVFTVASVNYTLTQSDIHSMFPYEGSNGEHGNVLPHILLNRSTLPWESSACSGEKGIPWLMLIVLHEGENTGLNKDGGRAERAKQTVSVTSLSSASTANIKWPGMTIEKGQHADEQVEVIDIEWRLLKQILPAKEDLEYLCHARKVAAFRITSRFLENLRTLSVSPMLLDELAHIRDFKSSKPEKFLEKISTVLTPAFVNDHKNKILEFATDANELAAVISNRLPLENGSTTVHLVSIQNRYKSSGFDAQGASDNDLIRFLCLKSWKFSCLSKEKDFTALLVNLNTEFLMTFPIGIKAELGNEVIPVTVKKQLAVTYPAYALSDDATIKKMASTQAPSEEKNAKWKITGKKNQFLVSDSGNGYNLYLIGHTKLRLPESENALAEKHFSAGYVAITHHGRDGSETVSWYKGPLSPDTIHNEEIKKITTDPASTNTITTSDQLLLYSTELGMFNVSYAAAWELGRALALKNKQFSLNLYQWKHTYRQHCKMCDSGELHCAPHDSTHLKENLSPEFPSVLSDWLTRLNLLEEIPFNYLVPDERMLPPESLRFFSLDNDWLQFLLSGAFSVGGRWKPIRAVNVHPTQLSYPAVSGFLLRSEVVAGWPGLLVDGFSKSGQLKVLKLERLSPGILLCLFDGKPTKVSFHQQPESLHFGFRKQGGQWHVKLKARGKSGTTTADDLLLVTDALWKNGASRVLHVRELGKVIEERIKTGKFTAAEFAFQMIEGVREVTLEATGDTI